jgi:hypothetical protein
MTAPRSILVALACFGSLAACGSRPAYWDATVATPMSSYGLGNAVAVVDAPANRVVLLSAQSDQQISKRSLPIGHNFASAATSADAQSLLVLSQGDWPRLKATDEQASLTVITVSPSAPFDVQAKQYWMSEPLSNLAIDDDPHEKQWAVAYAGSTTSGSGQRSFVENPNLIVMFDLTQPPNPSTAGAPLTPGVAPNPISRTIQSFGGTPQRLTFTPKLQLPNGVQQRLLVIETDQDVTLVDLTDAFPMAGTLPPPEITVPLSGNAAHVKPAGIAVYAGDSNNPARIAVRADGNTNVFTLRLDPPDAPTSAPSPGGRPPNAFKPTINLTDVRGVPADIKFVTTDRSSATDTGLRVAALVPTTSSAVLVEPDTSLTTTVALPAAYAKLSLVTNVLGAGTNSTSGGTAATDVALLWGSGSAPTSGVALWTLGTTVGQPYRSVEPVLSQPIQSVDDIPKPNETRKVLEMANGGGFFVLDLVARTAEQLTTVRTATLTIAPDGQRLWAFARGGTDLAAIEDFNALDPIRLVTLLPINAVYDVQRTDNANARSLIALHQSGAIGATVFDALHPDNTTSRRVSALLLEGP